MKTINTHFISNIVGFVLIVESFLMLTAAIIGEFYRETATSSIYISVGITLAVGLILRFLSFSKRGRSTTKREGFLTVTLVWIFLTIFGLLPYYLSGAIPHLPDAFFETMCGFTTTGSSVILNLEGFPKSLLFWRSLTQWVGGIGIVVFVMAFLPLFGGSAIQLFDAEVTGFMQNQITPRISKIAKLIAGTYLGFTIVGFFLLWAGPMNAFDAICHTLTSISTGGFSTKQTSVAFFNSAYVEYVMALLMFIGGTNFILLYLLIKKQSFKILRDEEFRWYFLIVAVFTIFIATTLLLSGKMTGIEYTFRTVLFQVISNITTSGFAVYDYLQWGQFYWFLFLALMIFCACEGSTSGGVKISRLVVLVKNTFVEFRRQVHPTAVLPVKMNDKVVPTNVVSKILAFMFLYTLLMFGSFLILSLTGMTFDEAIGASITAISNVGPGLGSNGPAGNFANLTDFAKIYMASLMLIGRLEIFTVLSLFIPSFWR